VCSREISTSFVDSSTAELSASITGATSRANGSQAWGMRRHVTVEAPLAGPAQRLSYARQLSKLGQLMCMRVKHTALRPIAGNYHLQCVGT
jgi:hypothetical protein